LNLIDIRDQSFHRAMYFNGVDPNWEPEGYVKVAFELGVNTWNGNESVQLLVRQMEPASQGTAHDK
jgi:RecJ OB domain